MGSALRSLVMNEPLCAWPAHHEPGQLAFSQKALYHRPTITDLHLFTVTRLYVWGGLQHLLYWCWRTSYSLDGPGPFEDLVFLAHITMVSGPKVTRSELGPQSDLSVSAMKWGFPSAVWVLMCVEWPWHTVNTFWQTRLILHFRWRYFPSEKAQMALSPSQYCC